MRQSFWSLFHFSLSSETVLAEAEVCHSGKFVCRLSTYMFFYGGTLSFVVLNLHTKMQTSGSATAVSELRQKQNRLKNDCLVEAKKIRFLIQMVSKK